MGRHPQGLGAPPLLGGQEKPRANSPESQPSQDAINVILFECYGLSNDAWSPSKGCSQGCIDSTDVLREGV